MTRRRRDLVWEDPTQSPYGYWQWQAHVERYDDNRNESNYYDVVIFADSSDEHADQNVNWEVSANGWLEKRGHSSSVRKAKVRAAALAEAMMSLGPREYRASPLPHSSVGIAGNVKRTGMISPIRRRRRRRA